MFECYRKKTLQAADAKGVYRYDFFDSECYRQ